MTTRRKKLHRWAWKAPRYINHKTDFFFFNFEWRKASRKIFAVGVCEPWHQLQRSEEMIILSPASPSPFLSQSLSHYIHLMSCQWWVRCLKWAFLGGWETLIWRFLAGEVTHYCSSVAMSWSVTNQIFSHPFSQWEVREEIEWKSDQENNNKNSVSLTHHHLVQRKPGYCCD